MKKILSTKWVHILLFLSIIINVFMAGFIVSRATMGPDRLEKRSHGMSSLASLTRYLPREQRREFFHGLWDQRGQFRVIKRELADINRDLIELLKAEEIDRDKLGEMLLREREIHQQMISRFQDSLVEGILKMPPTERKALLEEAQRNFEERQQRRKFWNDKDMLPPPPPGE
ncbi:periplasmic heavy metal sensor [Emcibacter sp.]|uniref:periplasmic heavy metal sensor n=1 Tax=Emcibacter sp. TaxID=1979954 RepID=UPI003A92CD80